MMEKSGISNKDLAEHLALNQQIVTDWKNGKSKSYTKYLYQIADFLGTTPEFLKGETDIKEKTPTVTDERITPSEYRLVLAYRAKPEMQEAVNKLLGIDEKAKPSPYASIAAYGDGEIQIGKKKPKITD